MVFDRKKQQELFDRYHSDRTVQSRNQIAIYNCGLVGNVAIKFAKQLKSSEYEDLYQIGYLGLISAIEHYDPKRGKFATFATYYIRGAILHDLRSHGNLIRIPRYLSDLLDRSRKVIRTLTSQLNRQPLDREIAAALDVQLEFWLEAKNCVSNVNHFSLDRSLDEHTTTGDLLADPRIDRYEEYLHLYDAIERCDFKVQNAIELVYFQELTRDTAATKLGVGSATVSRWLLQGKKELAIALTAN